MASRSENAILADMETSPALAVLIVLALMLLGGSAMTACGSIKPLRHILFLPRAAARAAAHRHA